MLELCIYIHNNLKKVAITESVIGMKTKKLLTILIVFLAVLTAMSTVIEAQRGGSSGGMGGGHHWSVNAGSDNDNVGDNNNAGIEVSVSTDKRMYVLGEPIEITVTAYNPTGYPVGVEYQDPCGIPLSYIIDGYITRYTLVDKNGAILFSSACAGSGGTLVLQPKETITQPDTRSAGSNYYYGDYVPLPVGRHRVVGTIGTGYPEPQNYDPPYKSKSITILVTDSNNGGM
jgi:hypothetical protein